MIAWLIRLDGEAAPVYYAPQLGRATGHAGSGWTAEKDQAIGFASKLDADAFIAAQMPRLQVAAVPHERRS